LGISLLNDDHVLAAFGFAFDFLLGAGFQRAFAFSFRAHALDCIHYVGLLGQERVPEIGRPLNVARQPLNHIRKRRHRLNARVPRLFGHRVGQRLVFQVFVFVHPLLELDHLQWVGRRCQRLG